MKVLALETSTAVGSVAIADGDKILFSESSDNPRTHTEFFNPAIARGLSETGLRLQDFDVFAVGSGPGSFTGLRVSAGIVKSFAMLYQKPIFSQDSLSLLIQQDRLHSPNNKGVYFAALNAHKNQLYVSCAGADGDSFEPAALTAQELEFRMRKVQGTLICLGEGFQTYHNQLSSDLQERIQASKIQILYPSAETLAILATKPEKSSQTLEWFSYKPLYIRASEAEEALSRKS